MSPAEVCTTFHPRCVHVQEVFVNSSAAALLQASLDSTFSLALLLTYAANVLIFFSLNMLWSAILGSLLLGDRLPRRTVASPPSLGGRSTTG